MKENIWKKNAGLRKMRKARRQRQTRLETANQTRKKEVVIGIARIKRARGLKGEYQYDTGAIHHTTNSFNNIKDIQQIDLQIEEHDQIVT